MKFRRHKTSLQQLAVILSMTIFIGLYFVSSSGNSEDGYIDIPEVKRLIVFKLLSIIRENVFQEKIIYWRRNQTLPTWATMILTNPGRIYFHETAGREALNLRQLCAIESAAKENPTRSVQIFFQADYVNFSGPIDSVMKQYQNIAAILINASDYFAETVYFNFRCFKQLASANDFKNCGIFSLSKVGILVVIGETVLTKRNIFPITSVFYRCTKVVECIWIWTLSH